MNSLSSPSKLPDQEKGKILRLLRFFFFKEAMPTDNDLSKHSRETILDICREFIRQHRLKINLSDRCLQLTVDRLLAAAKHFGFDQIIPPTPPVDIEESSHWDTQLHLVDAGKFFQTRSKILSGLKKKKPFCSSHQ